MARSIHRLSDKGVRAKAKPGHYSDGGGLYLQVSKWGTKSWVFKFTANGRTRGMGLGPFYDNSNEAAKAGLATARDDAARLRLLVRAGRDPIEDRNAWRSQASAEARNAMTFNEAVERCLTKKEGEFRNDKHRDQWRSTLTNYAGPILGDMDIAHITMQDVLRVLEPIWATKTATASRLRGRIEAVLSWATVAGFRSGDNPARWNGNLKELLPKPSAVAAKDNQPALSLVDLPVWFTELRKREGIAARALEFLTLCAARSGEIRGATWNEIDMEAGLWIIPANRMKAKREHRVPLTPEALALLKALPKLAGCDYVFFAPRGGALSDMALSAVMRRMHKAETTAKRKGWVDPRSGRAGVPHGLRSTFRDWAAETGVARDMAEIALAHTVGSEVERAYRRSDMLERRRALMSAWASACRGEHAENVIQLRAAM
jgi:integrase